MNSTKKKIKIFIYLIFKKIYKKWEKGEEIIWY